jgi:hypothetical protein
MGEGREEGGLKETSPRRPQRLGDFGEKNEKNEKR